MPYTTDHGPPDIDATHAWDPALAGLAAPPVINDQGGVWPPALPRIKLLHPPAGWAALPESDDNREKRTVGHGEIPYSSRKLGRTLVYECEVRAATLLTLRATMTATRRGFSDMDGEGTMTVAPWAYIGGPTWTFTARVLSLAPDPAWQFFERRLAPFRWGFALTLRMSDPLWYTGGVGFE